MSHVLETNNMPLLLSNFPVLVRIFISGRNQLLRSWSDMRNFIGQVLGLRQQSRKKGILTWVAMLRHQHCSRPPWPTAQPSPPWARSTWHYMIDSGCHGEWPCILAPILQLSLKQVALTKAICHIKDRKRSIPSSLRANKFHPIQCFLGITCALASCSAMTPSKNTEVTLLMLPKPLATSFCSLRSVIGLRLCRSFPAPDMLTEGPPANNSLTKSVKINLTKKSCLLTLLWP